MEKTIEEREQQFQDAIKVWEDAVNNNDPVTAKENWDIMFNRVYDACLNIGKTKCVGVRVGDLEGKCLDATCKIMEKIQSGVRPDKLSSYCYLWVIGQIWSKKEQRWDQSADFNDFDNYAYVENEDGFNTLCKTYY